VARLMAFDPAERSPDMAAVLQALLPFVQPRSHATSLAERPAAPDGTPPLLAPVPSVLARPSHRILIVDDENELRVLCRLVLGSDALHCEEAPDGAAAL